MNRRHLALLLLLLAWGGAGAQPSLGELVREADLVAVLRVEQVDYRKTRSFPSSGSAFLQVLIPYRGAERGDWIEVREQGLGDAKCYYPEPDPFAFEGARFLALLRREGEALFRGVAPGCRIPVLVTTDSSYAVRFPVPGLDLPEELARPVDYADPAAIVDAGDFTSSQLRELEEFYRARPVAGDPLEPPSGKYVYTLGIPLADIGLLIRGALREDDAGARSP